MQVVIDADRRGGVLRTKLGMQDIRDDREAFPFDPPREWSSVVREDPTARVVKGQMLVALKDAHLIVTEYCMWLRLSLETVEFISSPRMGSERAFLPVLI